MNKTNEKIDIIVVGAIGIDTNIYFYTNQINFEIEANYTKNIDYVGQAGGYCSRISAQLGYKTAFIGYIGKDFCGNQIEKTLLEDNINIDGLGVDPEGTKRSVNFMYPDGRRKNFYDGKGHMKIKNDLKKMKSIFRKGKLAHFNLMNWSRHLLPVAKKLGLKISCDLQDIVDIDDPYRRDFIKNADIIFFSSTNFPDSEPLIKTIQLRNSNPNLIIVVGKGKKGCILATKNKIKSFDSVNLQNLKIVDTNGAGDALAIGFLSSYLFEGYSLEESIIRGQINARYVCSIKASTSQFLNKKQLDSYFQNYINIYEKID